MIDEYFFNIEGLETIDLIVKEEKGEEEKYAILIKHLNKNVGEYVKPLLEKEPM